MDALSIRQKEIINYINNNEDYVSSGKIAEKFNLSTKTIHRELQIIKDFFIKSNIAFESKKGFGIKLHISREDAFLLNIKNTLDKSRITLVTKEQRRVQILSKLLNDSPKATSIHKLSEEFYISPASIVNDFKIMENWMKKYNLKFDKGINGTSIIGNENDIRKALVEIINDLTQNKKIEKVCYKSKRVDDITLKKLALQFETYEILKVEELLMRTEAKLGYLIGDFYYINILTHILILLKRIKSGKRIIYKNQEFNLSLVDGKIYKISELMAIDLEGLFSIKVPTGEIYYIYQYLVSSGMYINNEGNDTEDLILNIKPEIRAMVSDIIEDLQKVLNLKLVNNSELYKGLILHFKPMLNRLKYEINISNPLLKEINEEFPSLSLLVQKSIKKIETKYGLKVVSDDEISYIVLHFQAAIEESFSEKRILVVCSSGVGSSHLLKKRIENSFPKWKIVDIISSSYLHGKYDLKNIDLIISTIKVQCDNVPIAYVSALFTKDDVKRITETFISKGLNIGKVI